MDDGLRQLLTYWQCEWEALLKQMGELEAKVRAEIALRGYAGGVLDGLRRAQGATPYRVLGLDPSAPDEVVKLVYRHLAREHHPDRGGDNRRMAEINRAYQEIARQRGWQP